MRKNIEMKPCFRTPAWGPTLALSIFALVSSACTSSDTIASRPDRSAEFLRLADRHAALILETAPEWSTQLGISEAIGGAGFNRRLSNYSSSGNNYLRRLNAQLLDELNNFEEATLSGTAAITYAVMRNAYEIAARQNAHNIGIGALLGAPSPYVVNQLFSPHTDLPRLFSSQHVVSDQQQLDDYLARLSTFAATIDDLAALVESDASKGFVPPAFALEAVASAALGFVSSPPEENPIAVSLEQMLGTAVAISGNEKTAALGIARDRLKNEIYPAYTRFAERLRNLIGKAGPHAGLWRLKGGADLYQIALDSYGANGMTPDEIHNLGLNDVERIQAEMDALLRARGYESGSVGSRMNALSKDPSVLAPDTDAGKAFLLNSLSSYVDNVMTIAPAWFGSLPTQRLEVKRIPVFEENSSAGAYYLPPSLDGSRAGAFFINLKNTADWPLYSLQTLVFHEAVPGHHFQASLQQGVQDMPLIRNMMFFSEYGEGWALYAEELAVEMGLYKDDPLGNLGRLKAELYRAVRLVVDTGLHHKRWSREAAIDYMVTVTGETPSSIAREIERYAVWPGQATSYKLGMIRFKALRKRAETELGPDFDIREFHDAVLLDGSMPLPVLEARISAWIQDQLLETRYE